MTLNEQREAARQFANRWANKGREDEDARSFWIEILQDIFGVEKVTSRVQFEKKVVGADGNTKRIDVYIPETHVLIEQKSRGIALDKAQAGHDNDTPYQQAKKYDNSLPVSEKARWIITSNFAEIWIYNMDTAVPESSVVKIALDEMPDRYSMLDFLIDKEIKEVDREKELSLKAGELVGKIHDRFLEQYHDPMAKKTQNSLNILCVRLVFCLFAEDAGLFGPKDAFSKYILQYEPKDIRQALLNLFKVLDTPYEDRPELYLSDELEAFPYCNGGLFANENIVIPKITQEIKDTLIDAASFDWSQISPTIFGAVFESTLNPETRRSGGMHYTSIKNIHKVIDPLFLWDLQAELDDILKISVERTRKKKLQDYQNKLASLRFLDPAAGSGNFLTETYLCLRRLENKVISELRHGQIEFGFENANPIKVQIDQFYGIEINDFAVAVAKTALWIAESQMMKETEDVVLMHLDFLPLKTNAHIIEGNALLLDWNRIVNRNDLSYIEGNPPFVGARIMSASQKEDVLHIFGSEWKNVGNLDYVACWYKKTVDYISGTNIHAALVSTNSITQGESVGNLWKELFKSGINIEFAYRTFIWDSEAHMKAHVHCVIVGFSTAQSSKPKIIYDESGTPAVVNNINPYLIDADNVFIESRNKPICNVPEIGIGNKPIDDGQYLFEKAEMEAFIDKEPMSKDYFHPWYGSKEFINQSPRYCLYLGDCSPSELRKMPECMKRVEAVREYRLLSPSAGTRKLADTPTKFHVTNMPAGNYIVIPEVSSQRRRYIPMGYMDSSVLCSNLVKIMPNASLYHFGVLESNVHMAWVRTVCGRLKSDYRYSKDVVYNNFPWPQITDDQKERIVKTAQGILDARALYQDSSLADLYDPLTMPSELRKAHQLNDIAVMQVYGFNVKTTSESDCVSALMKMYQDLTT